MAVMSAGMHDTWILAAERQGCVFFDGKGIDICTERDRLTVRCTFSTLDHCPETVVIRVKMWCKTHFFQAFSNRMSRIFFFKRKLWMCMKIAALFNDLGLILFCHIFKIHSQNPFVKV